MLGFVFPVIVLNLWVFSGLYRAFEGVVSTFILAGVIALILNIPVRLLQKRLGFKRSWAIVAVFLLFSVGVILASATLVPMLVIAFFRLVQTLPEWIDSSDSQQHQRAA
ncbi:MULTISPECIES: AI-2E family transporter [Synechococcaceae]|uniref:AI-2E family transporter n=1 Tax=Synechococcaceae TaxID=1890426 RepID=UPI0013C53297|nr:MULTISPECIES: AI-2E family transporter [Synechococcaceae]MCT0245866.1 AI-2E family transporter [Synechococcus sp. CS-601]MCT4367996.1 AI-2E family transporter [Candidatus Regnicoccus frigidus MAG-AL2]